MTDKTLENPKSVGDKLFQTGSDFYTWYMSWLEEPGSQSEIFKLLSELMRVGLLSFEGGQYLSLEEEDTALHSLTTLKEELCDCKIRQTEVAKKLQNIMDSLITNNPKAKLIVYATDIEYKYCIKEKSSLKIKQLQTHLNTLVRRITPSFLSINTYAISQILCKTLEESPPNAEESLAQEIKKWIELNE